MADLKYIYEFLIFNAKNQKLALRGVRGKAITSLTF